MCLSNIVWLSCRTVYPRRLRQAADPTSLTHPCVPQRPQGSHPGAPRQPRGGSSPAPLPQSRRWGAPAGPTAAPCSQPPGSEAGRAGKSVVDQRGSWKQLSPKRQRRARMLHVCRSHFDPATWKEWSLPCYTLSATINNKSQRILKTPTLPALRMTQ